MRSIAKARQPQDRQWLRRQGSQGRSGRRADSPLDRKDGGSFHRRIRDRRLGHRRTPSAPPWRRHWPRHQHRDSDLEQESTAFTNSACRCSASPPPAQKKAGFEKGKAPAAKKVGAELGEIGGTPVNFAETTPPAILVDFDGGKRTDKKIRDESAAQLLILNADGKLIVRSSRTDSDPDTAEFKTRQKRIDDWKAKVEPLRNIENPMGNPAPPQPNNAILGGNRRG